MTKLLRNRDFIFLLALGLGLAAGGGAAWSRPLALPALALVMTLSCLGATGRLFRSPRDLLAAAAAGVFLPYLVLGGLFTAASLLFRHDRALWDGMILLALVPPGVAVIPFTDSLGGNSRFSLLATACAYLAGLAVTPAVGVAVWGAGMIRPGQLLGILFELIVLPLVVSRLLLRASLAERIAPVRGIIINWSFFVVIYTIVGLNRRFLFQSPQVLVPLGVVAGVSTFGLAALLRRTGRAAGLAEATVTSSVLLGTLKNYGLAGGLALTFFSDRAALPAVVAGAIMIPYVVWLGRSRPRPAGAQGEERGSVPGRLPRRRGPSGG